MQELREETPLQGGKYNIKRVLGQGGFGITYLAEQVSLGRKVAIKEFFMKDGCLREQATGFVTVPTTGAAARVEQFRKKFFKEARTLAGLDHPHIVSVIDVFEENGTVYYSMPFMPNGSLKSLVKSRGRLSETEALRYVGQVASALQYMHTEHLCHYDVKPDNILLDSRVNAVLIDFGISKNYDSEGNETSTTPIGISEGYAPIEQYQGISDFSPASDVYALGATLYYLLEGKTPPSAISRVQGNELSFNEDISAHTQSLINEAMELSVTRRLKDVEPFIKAAPSDTGQAIPKKTESKKSEPENVSGERKTSIDETAIQPKASHKDKGQAIPKKTESKKSEPENVPGERKRSIDETAIQSKASHKDKEQAISKKTKSKKSEPENVPGDQNQLKNRRRKKSRRTVLSIIAILALVVFSAKIISSRSERTMTQEEKDAIIQQAIDDMVYVTGGTFTMGATSEQDSDALDDEKPTHQVTLWDYRIGKYEVTQELWQAVTGFNPSAFKNDPKNPVERVSLYDCEEFLEELNRLTGKRFRLPTEAEWEYAARGGNKSRGYKYSGSNTLGDVAWYNENSSITTHPVGLKSPNELGLYDMSGNVNEWCQDRYSKYSSDPQTRPLVTYDANSYSIVYRGGSWKGKSSDCRVSRRGSDSRSNDSIIGLRLVL